MRSRGEGSKAFDEDVAAQVKALVAHKRADCRRVVRAFRKLGRGKRRELGLPANYLVSLIEDELARKRRKKST